MSAPQQLSRPLSARVASLPDPPDPMARQGAAETSKTVIQAAFEALDAGRTHYTDRPGILPLREKAVAEIGRRCGLELSADEATITCGATEARFVAIKKLVKPGQKILCAGSGAAVQGPAALIGAALTDDPNAEGIALIYLNSADPADRVEACAGAAISRESIWLIWDMSPDAGSAFHPAHLHPSLAERTITIGAVGDAHRGWRVGWLAGSKAANALRAYKQSITICTPSISQWAAMGIADPASEE
ncbi:MAG: hypothetical protein JNL42_09085 [Anaerolineae bacterium]|nr:hypothetical protein [Anaerolineae bacterium]